jgi:hypothetical protein
MLSAVQQQHSACDPKQKALRNQGFLFAADPATH